MHASMLDDAPSHWHGGAVRCMPLDDTLVIGKEVLFGACLDA